MLDRSSPLRTVVVDDSPSFRSLLINYLNDEEAFAVVGSAANGVEAEHVIDLTDPDVVILDVHLPETSGLEVLDELRPRHEHTMFAVTSSDDSVEDDALERGADLYLDKLTPFDEICDSIRSHDSEHRLAGFDPRTQ
jgi:DNA-binding NarL/FixJ family response regulator